MSADHPMNGMKDEDVEAQLDRLNAAIAKTLEAARLTIAQSPQDDSLVLEDSFQEIQVSQNRLDFSRIDDNECIYLFTDPGMHCGGSVDGWRQEDTETVDRQLNRVQMQCEDILSASLRVGGTLQTTEVTQEDITAVREAVDRLETAHYAQFRIGHICISARLQGFEPPFLDEEDGVLTRRSLEADHDESHIVLQLIKQQKNALDARERALCERESELHAEFTAFNIAKRRVDEEHEKFVEAAKQQTAQALTLKERIELMLHDQQESTFDLSSVYASDVAAVKGQYAECEAELDSLRKQLSSMQLEPSDHSIIKKEMDLAEDILVGVLNGDDPRKLHLQVTVVKNKIVHIRGKQVMRDAEKMASNINSTICALEGSRISRKTKNRIKENIIKKLKTPGNSPERLPHKEQQRPQSMSKPLTLSLESLSSPLDTPVAHSRQVSMYLPKIEVHPADPFESDLRAQLHTSEERTARLRVYLRDLQVKLDRYKALERRMIEDRGQIKIAERRNVIVKETLDDREKRMAVRENEIALREDSLRNGLTKIVGYKEAKDYLAVTTKQLTDQSHKLAHDQSQMDFEKASLRVAREEIIEARRVLEKERRRIAREYAKMEKEKKKIADSKKELAEFLPQLQAQQGV